MVIGRAFFLQSLWRALIGRQKVMSHGQPIAAFQPWTMILTKINKIKVKKTANQEDLSMINISINEDTLIQKNFLEK